ncbi:hypothetical protein QBC36DRAFT_370780 [Triangularia setosa]|uniref:Uncharacterized protein n=1 Tax=Triangularia setosa TaxID=2587417 RepID=A0AAN6WB10_9PEZI|nr:hypothetical protein QBC36DRAFT_370780 [Podospora setosa]
MKFTTTTLIITLQTTLGVTVLASPAASVASISAAKLEADCGVLHVMAYNETALPPDVDPTHIRKCVEHPSGSAIDAQAEEENTIGKRDCVSANTGQYGCGRGGYCWKRCDGNGGSWCWQAVNSGWGDWIKCTSSSQCNPQSSWGCGQGPSDCDACGCSCSGGLPW